MHQRGDRTKHAVGMVNEAHQLAEIRLASEVDHAFEFRMMMAECADLYEKDFATKIIDYPLVSIGWPPFNGYIVLPPGCNDPERGPLAGHFMDLRVPGSFQVGEMDITFESGWLDREAEALVQKVDETMQAVIGGFIALVDQRVAAIDQFDPGRILHQRREVRVVV